MKKTLLITLLFTFSSIYSQDLDWDNSIEGNFTIDSVNLGIDGNLNTVNVSGKAGNWTVYMTYYFTNKLETEDQGEYNAMAWAFLPNDF